MKKRKDEYLEWFSPWERKREAVYPLAGNPGSRAPSRMVDGLMACVSRPFTERAPRWFPAQASPLMFPWSLVSSDRARHHFSCCSRMGTTIWPSWRSESSGCRQKKQPLSPKCGPHLQAPVAAHKPAIVWAKSSHRVSPLLVSRRKPCSKENQAMCCTWTRPLCQEVLYAGFSGAPEKFTGAGDRLLPTVPKTVSHQRFNIHVATDAIPSDQMAWKCPWACRSLKVAERATLPLQNTSACITQRLPWRPGRPKCANPGCSGSKIPPFPNVRSHKIIEVKVGDLPKSASFRTRCSIGALSVWPIGWVWGRCW